MVTTKELKLQVKKVALYTKRQEKKWDRINKIYDKTGIIPNPKTHRYSRTDLKRIKKLGF